MFDANCYIGSYNYCEKDNCTKNVKSSVSIDGVATTKTEILQLRYKHVLPENMITLSRQCCRVPTSGISKIGQCIRHM